MYLNRENDTCYFFGKHVFHKNVKNVIKSLLLGVTVIPSLKGSVKAQKLCFVNGCIFVIIHARYRKVYIFREGID